MDKNPVCFGSFPKGATPCAKCEFFDSCRYFTATARKVRSRSGLASFDANSYRIPVPADCEHIPGVEKDDPKTLFISMIGSFFRYLLELDEYTIGLISQIIAAPGSDRSSIKTLSRLRGCSRQAIHFKILSVIAVHPELSTLFQNVMDKLSAGRRTFLRHRAGGTGA